MPEIIEETASWRPTSMQITCRVFTEKHLAIWAFESSPEEYRTAFEECVELADAKVLATIQMAHDRLAKGANVDELRSTLMDEVGSLKEILERISSIITALSPSSEGSLDQSAIDALFD